MNTVSDANMQERFFTWLSERVSPAQLSELYMAYNDIDKYFVGKKVLKAHLFQTTDLAILSQIRNTIEGDRYFRVLYKRSLRIISAAMRYYMDFLKESAIVPQEKPAAEVRKSAVEPDSSEEKNKPAKPAEETRKPNITAAPPKDEIQTVDLADERSYAFTTPISFSYFGEETAVSSWREVYTKCIAILLDDYPSAILSLRGSPIVGRGRMDLCAPKLSALMAAPKKVSDEVYAETNYSASDLMLRLRALLDRCNVDYENLQITFRHNTAPGSGNQGQGGTRSSTGGEGGTPGKKERVVLPPPSITVEDIQWLSILVDSFPNGYILNDFLCRLQAAGLWQERYGETCPLEGAAIDEAMKAIGTVLNDRIFPPKKETTQLISEICDEVDAILSRYTTVYRSCIFERYRDRLSACQIYTEQVMTEQLLGEAGGRFESSYQYFERHRQNASVRGDCRRVLREQGGAMSTGDVAKTLWFIPSGKVYNALNTDEEILNVDLGVWMLAEHFPLTRENAQRIGDVLGEQLLTKDYVHTSELRPLLRKHLPSIADDLSGLTNAAVFNIVAYYLADRFSFTRAIISPKGANTDFTVLFRTFAAEHDTFTIRDLEAFAEELNLPIYWNNTYNGGAVRISQTNFVNRRLVHFDVDAVDRMLENFCSGDYLPLQAVPSAMMLHLPACGYAWNGYLLLSYVRDFSKQFHLVCNSLGKTGFYGAMVRNSCREIDDYNSLVERVLTDDDSWTTTKDALNLLVKRGYQALKKYRDIDTIVENARRNKKYMGGESSAQV